MLNYGTGNRGASLVAFFLLTFAITWGLALLIVLFPGPFEAFFGKLSPSNPVFIVAVAGPTIAATTLTFARGGWSGLRMLYARLTQWRFGLQWYALLLVGMPLLGYLASWAAGSKPKYDLSTPAVLVMLLLNELILGPLGEELGWRGFALPRLLQRFSPLVASLILGAIWGLWHLPAFFLSGLPQANLALPIFLFGALCLSILATWIYTHTGGSVLSMVLFHFMINCSMDVLGAPLPAFTVVMAVAAALVLLLDRRFGWFRHEPTRVVWMGIASA
jgi:membrane protease YdiL (CAAX protease family)